MRKARLGIVSRKGGFGLALRLAAPYLAVGVFWCGFENAWPALIAYHVQIIGWARGTRPALAKPRVTRTTWFILPAALAGPALYVLLPHIARVDLALWLERFHLTGSGLLVMTAYFGLVHPFLEQIHWTPLRERTRWAHPAFAGYHVLVLALLLPVVWLVACFAVLWLASWTWKRMTRAAESLVPAIASQALADLGIVLVAVRVLMG